jgi:hypothetical protein
MQHSISYSTSPQKMFSPAALLITGLVVAVTALSGVAALALRRQSASASRPITLQCALDGSDSARDSLLGPSALAAVRLVSQLDPDRDRLWLYRVDRDTQRICGPDVPESGESLERTLISQMQTEAQQAGTYPATFWEMAARQAAEEATRTAQPIAIVFFTDGDNDDRQPQAMARILAAARRLASNPYVVAVCVFGVKKENTGRLDKEFAALGERFRLYPASDLNIAPVCNRLEEARQLPCQLPQQSSQRSP